MAQFNYINKAGETVSADVSLMDYKVAGKQNLNLSQFLQNKYGADADTVKFGSVFSQACQSVGIHKPNAQLGIVSPTLAQVVGDISVSGGSFTAPDGSDSTPAGRIFYPELVMAIIREKLLESHESTLKGFDSMIALKETIASEMYVQPMIDTTAPESSFSEPMSQLALPKAMVSITASQIARNIQTKSIGIMISEQAMQYATLDLVGIAVAAQARGERVQNTFDNISAILNGDLDVGTSALTSVKAQTFDSSIVAAGVMSHKALLHMCFDEIKKRSINSMICDLDTFLAFEGRVGAPLITGDKGTDQRLTTGLHTLNFGIADLNVLLVDTAVLGANTALMFDKNYALRQVINSNASYDAIESYVMMRAKGLRIDFGEHLTRLYDDAFLPVTLTV